jgi:hypothetical protein
VFTALYELSPYIKQTGFAFKGLRKIRTVCISVWQISSRINRRSRGQPFQARGDLKTSTDCERQISNL